LNCLQKYNDIFILAVIEIFGNMTTSVQKKDNILIYTPSLGDCNFKNIEFDTVLNFDDFERSNGRNVNFNGKKIAVIGDSHTMGWGVEDNETFSAILEESIKQKVYNLGVSSYATERKFIRLINHSNFKKIETIFAQYCDNDFSENTNFPVNIDIGAARYKDAMKSYKINQSNTLGRVFFRFIQGLY
jgi:hypothetical protein